MNARLRDGRAQLAYGVTEHVILDAESGGRTAIIGGNANKLPFSLIARSGIGGWRGCAASGSAFPRCGPAAPR